MQKRSLKKERFFRAAISQPYKKAWLNAVLISNDFMYFCARFKKIKNKKYGRFKPTNVQQYL